MKEYQIIDMILTLKLSNTTKLVFMAMARRLDWSTWSKAMSVSYIHKMLGESVSQRGISRALAELSKLKLISRSESGRSDNTKLITLNVSELVHLSTIPPVEVAPPDTMSDPDTMADLTLCHTTPDTMSDPPMTPCQTTSDTMSDNKLYNTLNNNSLNTLSTDKSSQETSASAFIFSIEEDDSDDDVDPQVSCEDTNEKIRLSFLPAKPNPSPADQQARLQELHRSAMSDRRRIEDTIYRAQNYDPNKRRRGPRL